MNKKQNVENIKKAQAMKCFGSLVWRVEHDPDPKAQDKLQEEMNCKNCAHYPYCSILADTLK